MQENSSKPIYHTDFQKFLYIDKILIVSIYLHSSSSDECQSTSIMALRFVLLCAGLSLVLAVPHRQKRFLTDTGTRLKPFSLNKYPQYETFYTAYFYLLRKKLLVNVLNYLNSQGLLETAWLVTKTATTAGLIQ